MKKETFRYFLIFALILIGISLLIADVQSGFWVAAAGFLIFSLFSFIQAISLILKIERWWPEIIPVIEKLALSLIGFVFASKLSLSLFLGINTIYLAGILSLISITLFRLLTESYHFKSDKISGFTSFKVSMPLFIFVLLVESLPLITDQTFPVLSSASFVLMVIYFLLVSINSIQTFRKESVLKDYLHLDVLPSHWLLIAFFFLYGFDQLTSIDWVRSPRFKRKSIAWVELFYKAESGKEKPVDGKYEFQLFEENLEKFKNKLKKELE